METKTEYWVVVRVTAVGEKPCGETLLFGSQHSMPAGDFADRYIENNPTHRVEVRGMAGAQVTDITPVTYRNR